MTALIEYSKEIVPMFLSLGTKKQILKEFMDDDSYVQECLQEIAAMQENIKDHVAEKEPELVREIKALETDIALACKGAARGTAYKAAELKGFFAARAKLNVEKVVGKGELFSELDKELA
jgi:hypothetical protein